MCEEILICSHENRGYNKQCYCPKFGGRSNASTIEEIPYISIATDASNHGYKKMFPLVVQYFSVKDGGYQFKLIELQSLSNETSKSIKDYIITTLNNKGIAAKSIAFGGDNTNTNFGGVARNPGNNIFTKLKTELKCGGEVYRNWVPRSHPQHSRSHRG